MKGRFAPVLALLALGCGRAPSAESGVTGAEQAPLAYAERDKLVSSTGANLGAFGQHLAMNGNTMLVAGGKEGAAYVFERSGATYVETARIDPWEGETAWPINRVALDGDTAVIGSAEYMSWSGVVFVYRRSAQSWTLEKRFESNGEGWGDQLDLQGDTLLLSAPGFDGTPVLAYERSGTTWGDTPQTLTPDTYQPFFGTSIALSGDTAIIGSMLSDASVGAAYVFERENGVWAQAQRLTAKDRTKSGDFGSTVAIDGDTIVVGARSAAGEKPDGSGALYVFDRGQNGFTETTRLLAPPSMILRYLGWSLTMDGDTVLAGSQDDVQGTGSMAGSAYLFERNDGEWSFEQRLLPSEGEALAEYGWAVGLSDGFAAVGSPFIDGTSTVDQGAVYLWVLLGGACDSAADCLSGFCADGVCCDTACDGACDVCSEALGAEEDGVCAPAPIGSVGEPACAPDACNGESVDCEPCETDAQCPPGLYCADGGACTPDKRKGSTCDDTAGADCAEDGCRVCRGGLPCVDGVCCDTPCDGACDACKKTLGASADGTCTVLAEGTGSPTCRNGFACDGSGPDCPTSCSADVSCRPSHRCTAQETCEPRNCDEASDCGTAAPYCVDGICCDEPCTGQCEACDVSQREGLCSAVTGTPHGERTECVGAGEECGGTCDGETRARCSFDAAGSSCGTSTCSGGTAEASSCDGQGACVAAEPVTCAPYACGAATCLGSCSGDTDCASGYTCEDGDCLFSGGRCSEDGKLALEGDGTPIKDCTPYRCTNGQCGESCSSTSDCQSGFVCDTTAEKCIPTASDVTDEGGCACRTSGRARGDGSAVPLLALALLAALRRRRSATGPWSS